MSEGSDNYIPQKANDSGKLSFHDGSYSDSFVRSETQPLVQNKRRSTRPFSFNPETLQREIQQGLEQLRTCQIIIDKFQQRIRILHWAVDMATKKNSGLTLSGKEKQIGDAILRTINHNPDTRKRVQIAVFQYTDAADALREGQQLLNELSADSNNQTNLMRMIDFDIAKIQGKIYPLCNFHEVFKRDVEISLLFPAPTSTSEPEMKMAAMGSMAAPPPEPAPPRRTEPLKGTNPLMKLGQNPLMEKISHNPLVDKIKETPLGNMAEKLGNTPLMEKLNNSKEALEKLNPMEKLGSGMDKLKGLNLKGMLGKKKDE